MINEHWGRTNKWIILFLFVPYIIMLIVYTFWSNYTLQGASDWAVEAGTLFQNILVGFSLYFLVFELIQFVTHPIQYFLELWSYIKVLPMLLVLYNAILGRDEQ